MTPLRRSVRLAIILLYACMMHANLKSNMAVAKNRHKIGDPGKGHAVARRQTQRLQLRQAL